MDLHLTLAAGPAVTLPSGTATEEIVVDTALASSGASVRVELAMRTGATHFFIDGLPLEQMNPGDPPLIDGAVIVAAQSPDPGISTPSLSANLLFAVHTGPDAGKLIPLARGVYRIGRSAPEITIHDPELSRIHAVLTVTNEAITLKDRDSANGVWVNGSRVIETGITTDSLIRMGASQCSLVLIDTPVTAVDAIDLTEPCEVAAPTPPEPNRLLLVTALLPLVLGVVLAVTTGMWFFLAFSALSAVTGLIPLMTGRRKRAAFGAAVSAAAEKDRERRRRAVPEVADLALIAVRQRSGKLAGTGEPPSCRGRYLRLGAADQPAILLVKPTPPEWSPPTVSGAPLAIPLFNPDGDGPLNLTVTGSEETLTDVAHLILLQLSLLEDSGGIVCYGPPESLPHPARFLPRVQLVTSRVDLDQLISSGSCSTLLLFGEQAGTVVRLPKVRLYRFCPPATTAGGPGWAIDYTALEPILSAPAGKIRFEADYVCADTFERIARGLGSLPRLTNNGKPAKSLPSQVSLSGLVAWDPHSVARRWQDPSDGSSLDTVIGSSREGDMTVDLVGDGPHFLVAGTTGAGKSELLRTLVLSLGINYSPADLNFLFIDFKGGSGLGVLACLPHVTGLLTDLSPASVTRALVSLRAEVKRREGLFAGAGVTDYLEYRATGRVLPRLAIVIDEFRMLAEEVPGSVHELMRIATLGRSLGLHLVLATQRPQGAVTSDIRANVTTSIALRMQTPMESQDVLESTIASTVPLHLRGRGYIRVGGQTPVEFQTATTSAAPTARRVAVTSLAFYLGRADHLEPAVEPDSTAPALITLIDAVRRASGEVALPPLRVPVKPPLPNLLFPGAGEPGNEPGEPDLGLLDVPDVQAQYRLSWNPERDAHLAFVGQPAGGLSAALNAVAGQLVKHRKDTHLYVLDGDGSLRSLVGLPQVGAYVGAGEVRRGARILQRISELIQERVGAGSSEDGPDRTSIAVLVSGWGRWANSLRSGKYAWAEEALQDIARDGEAARVTLLIGGDRELLSSRFFPILPNRAYFPMGTSPESLLAWPKMPALDAVPGRAFVQGRISSPHSAVAQFILQAPVIPSRKPECQPFPVAPLPPFVAGAELVRGTFDGHRVLLPIGVGGDDLRTQYLTLPPRGAALIVGTPASGRSNALRVLARHAPTGLRTVLLSPHTPEAAWRESVASATPDVLFLVDDADQLPRENHQLLTQVVAAGARAVLVTSASPAAVAAIPLAAAIRTSPMGLVMGARSPSDGDVFGTRLDVNGRGAPGRGFLIDSGGAVEVQVASDEQPPVDASV